MSNTNTNRHSHIDSYTYT